MAILADDISINTMIGSGSIITGNVKISGFVRVDGDIDGNLETTGKIIIGDKARIRGDVSSSSVIVGGIVNGDIIAPDFVQIFSSAIILGDVISKRVKVEQGAIIEGYCLSVSDEEEFTRLKERWQDKRSVTEKTFFGKH